jgi:uncharacterized OsmC-like protein
MTQRNILLLPYLLIAAAVGSCELIEITKSVDKKRGPNIFSGLMQSSTQSSKEEFLRREIAKYHLTLTQLKLRVDTCVLLLGT